MIVNFGFIGMNLITHPYKKLKTRLVLQRKAKLTKYYFNFRKSTRS